MKAVLIAAGVLAATVTSAAAQFFSGPPPGAPPPWARDRYPYAERHHRICQDKAWRLYSYERRAASDGFLTPRERFIMRELRFDLDRTCGRWRWRG